ncbi:hypothetical protein ONZ43_g1189 [Nemania bipapillata]|uniref:Uncharacterized protein n=1 Tax=Nemania bipapillata TaxID=110536 RepID=A0ACC2J5K8_9PEZI|nr:hypothetical protein ONZ43_g1189 [Nemania bipapillata]
MSDPSESGDSSSSGVTYLENILPAPKQLHMGLFEVRRELGSGSFGRVFLARHLESGFICALKVLIKTEIAARASEKHVRREIEVHSNLRHPGILGFYGWFHDETRVVMILEYAVGGELFDLLVKSKHFSEPCAARYIAQITMSLAYLQQKHVIHRDIKPENILIGVHGELKLADFGYSIHSPGNSRETVCGTLCYLAPEMTLANPRYTNAVDQWALGVLTYELLTGHSPFDDASSAITPIRIRNLDMPPLPSSVSPEAKHFIHSLLVLDPAQRLPLKDALVHPWILKHAAPSR